MSSYSPGAQGLLKPIESWLNDHEVSEILLNQPKEIWIEKYNRLRVHPVPEFTLSHLHRLFQFIANENNQRLSKAYPLLSASLEDGSRVQLCLPPTAKHPTFAIRKKVVHHLSLNDYQNSRFYQEVKTATLNNSLLDTPLTSEQRLIKLYEQHRWHEFVLLAIELKKNIVISGATSSGKTTYLNACLQHINPNERIILLEDTREIELPHHNQVQLLASKGLQGEAKITMQDLVQCSLRLRPDRIIMGEIRAKEIMDFVSSCSCGHEGAITSIHANNPHMAFLRMVQMYKLNNVPAMTDAQILSELKAVIDIVIHLINAPRGRRVDSIYYRYGP